MGYRLFLELRQELSDGEAPTGLKFTSLVPFAVRNAPCSGLRHCKSLAAEEREMADHWLLH